jgi:hypothetical protein
VQFGFERKVGLGHGESSVFGFLERGKCGER